MNDFDDDLAFSHAQSDAPWWAEVYKQAFPGFESMVCVRKDGWAQRGGIDRVITLSSGKVVTVDEKARRRFWPDVLLERWSSEEHKTPGWVQKNLACDYLAYAWVPSKTCLVIPFLALRRVWIDKGRDWIAKYPEKRAENKTYTTVSVAVPTEILMDSLRDGMQIKWEVT
jgi:hypothetical protein